MNRQEKQQIVKTIKEDFQSSQSAFVVEVKGLTVESVQGLRKNLRNKGAKLKVTKNTLLKQATKDIPALDKLAPYFKNQVAIVFSSEDIPGVAKVIVDMSKEVDKLKIIVGSLNEQLLDSSQIQKLASLPTQDVLRAQVCGALKAPIFGFVNVLNQNVIKLLWVLQQAAGARPRAKSDK